METKCASSAAVSQVLDVDNYFDWSVQVKTYLMAKDLWDIVEATDEPPKQENDEAASRAWTKKNVKALHVIQLSCGPRICYALRMITSAKIAWDNLAAICKLPKSSYDGISLSQFQMLQHFKRKIGLRSTKKKINLQNSETQPL
jgi:hypothetical protein